jgi:hypothetical protein
MERTMLEGVLIDEMIEVSFQLTGDFGRSPGARAIHQAPHTLVGKAVDPFPQGGIGKVQRVGDCLETLPGDDGTDRLGTAEGSGFFRLFYEGIEGGQGIIRKVEFEGPHMRVSSNKLLQKYAQPPSHDVVTLLSAQNLSDSNFPESAKGGGEARRSLW